MYQLRNKKYDIVIKNGTLIDTIGGFERKEDIGVTAGKITAIGTLSADDAKMTVDAEGCYVSAGLIDYHCHVFHGGDWASCSAEAYALPNGCLLYTSVLPDARPSSTTCWIARVLHRSG